VKVVKLEHGQTLIRIWATRVPLAGIISYILRYYIYTVFLVFLLAVQSFNVQIYVIMVLKGVYILSNPRTVPASTFSLTNESNGPATPSRYRRDAMLFWRSTGA